MNRISSLLLGTGFVLIAATGFAGTTSLDGHWTCTTNASSSSVDADKNADNEMSEKAKSASDAFAFASKHCRDCTKITCESDND